MSLVETCSGCNRLTDLCNCKPEKSRTRKALELYTGTVPKHLWDGIEAYVEEHTKPGSFLLAVFQNDLLQAVCRADEECLRNIVDISKFVFMDTPASCNGTHKKVEDWIKGAKL